jgi:hypothetical protein
MNKKSCKFIVLLLVIGLTGNGSVLPGAWAGGPVYHLPSASKAVDTDLDLPADLGRVEKATGRLGEATREKPFVVLLQDVHGNFKAQENIVRIVEHIQTRFPAARPRPPFLIEGLIGAADGAPKDGKITVKELEAYLNEKVPELTKQYRGTAQYPNSFAKGQDFPIGLQE